MFERFSESAIRHHAETTDHDIHPEDVEILERNVNNKQERLPFHLRPQLCYRTYTFPTGLFTSVSIPGNRRHIRTVNYAKLFQKVAKNLVFKIFLRSNVYWF